jgi:hypothetical protein
LSRRSDRILAVVLFLYEPFLAAGLLLRIGPTLMQRDAATWAAFAFRLVLALGSVAASIGLRESRPYGRRLAMLVLAASAGFAGLQYFTRVLPTSLAPDVAGLFTTIIVAHHVMWIAFLAYVARTSQNSLRSEF